MSSTNYRATVLAAKTSPPVVSEAVIGRERIRALANRFPSKALVLLTAPAGCGKTIALSQCFHAIRENGHYVTWISADPFDNEPARFFKNLLLAFRQVKPGFANKLLTGLPEGPDSNLPFLLTEFLNECLFIEGRVVVFIDDFHEIRNDLVIQGLDYILRYLPDNITIALGGRGTLSLHVARLRAQNRILELGWRDLAFSDEEAATLFTQVHNLEIAAEHRRVLCERTEGWATGLQLAALAMSHTENIHEYVESFSGASPHIADFLFEDVYGKLREPEQFFLTRTSTCTVLTASLCDTLTERTDGQKMLESLERQNLFTFPLDENRTLYRYHKLFRDFLHRRLVLESSSAPATLALRASNWFEAQGEHELAIRHAVDAGHPEQAIAILTTFGRELLAQGDLRRLRSLLELACPTDLGDHPQLSVLNAWSRAFMGDLDAARAHLQSASLANGTGDSTHPSSLFLESTVLRAALGVIEKDEPVTAGLDWVELPSRIPSDELMIRAFSHVVLSHVARADNAIAVASAHVNQALTLAERANSPFMSLIARYNWGLINTIKGKLRIAASTLTASIRYADRRGWIGNMGTAFVRVQLGAVLREQNALQESATQLDVAIDILKSTEAFGFMGIALVERAHTAAALGEREDMHNYVQRALTLSRERGLPKIKFRATLAQVAWLLGRGDHTESLALIQDLAQGFGDSSWLSADAHSESSELFLCTLLDVLLSRGEHSEVIRLAAKATKGAHKAGRWYNVTRFLVYQAAGWSGKSRTRAVRKLDQALSLAKGNSITRAFSPIVAAAPTLLHTLPRSSEATAVLNRLGLADMGTRHAPRSTRSASYSPRELQILVLVAAGLRNRGIARKLFISENTVKWHLRNLYDKLDVGSRTQAIAKARALGLID